MKDAGMKLMPVCLGEETIRLAFHVTIRNRQTSFRDLCHFSRSYYICIDILHNLPLLKYQF